MIETVALPWFIGFFVAGAFVLGFNALKDWQHTVSYPVFDVLMMAVLVGISFFFNTLIPVILTGSLSFVCLMFISKRGYIGEGDVYSLTWTPIGVGIWWGLPGLIIFLLATWIANLSMVIANRKFKRWSGQIPLVPALFIGFVLGNIIMFIVGG